ncbi:MAG TPA: RDD family protein [Steroidobacteraceae bacterium]
MNMFSLRRLSFWFALLCLASVCATSISTHAWADDRSAAASAAASPGSQDDFNDESDSANNHGRRARHHRHDHNDGSIVAIGHGGHLESGQRADSVVSIFGSSTSEGEAGDVVSILGNTRVTGPVGDSAVAVLGSTYIDAKVNGDVVAVLGNVELGPNAEVGGDVVSVLGVVKRDPAAIVHGSVQRIFDVDVGGISGFKWLDTWITHCLLYARPLAFAAGLGWAWTLALGFLAFYACLALMFRSSVDQCVHTLETQPGRTALAALLTMLLTPVVLVLLCITLIGIAAVPFVALGLFCAGLFGKAVMLAWLGGRIAGGRPGGVGHPAIAVLIGGALVLVLYVIPVAGFLVYKLLGFFGLGAVVYTLILRSRERRAANNPPPGGFAASAIGTMPGATASASMPGASMASESVAAAAAPGATMAVAGVPAHISAAMPRAGFWIRMLALLLDVILVGFLMSLLHPFHDVHILVLAIYGAVMWKLRGSTVGGIVFDLHVVRVDGRPIDWETAIVRALGCILSLVVVGLGFIWIAFDPNNQAWHDKIAGTVVVQAKKGAPLA